MTDTSTRPDTKPRLREGEPGDHDRFSHYVLGRDPKAKITRAMIEGRPVRALCGKKWVPSRDPSRFPICPRCREIKSRILGKE